jgi:hypothetical protein
MSDRFWVWQSAIASRDAALIQLAALSLAGVLLWWCIFCFPASWQPRARGGWCLSVVVAFYGTLFLIARG